MKFHNSQHASAELKSHVIKRSSHDWSKYSLAVKAVIYRICFLGPAAYFNMICVGHHFKRWQKAGDYLTRVTFSPLCSKFPASPMVKKRLGGVNKCGCPLPSAASSSVKFMLPLQSFSCQVSSTADPFLQTPATHFHDVFHLWEVFLWMWDSEAV